MEVRKIRTKSEILGKDSIPVFVLKCKTNFKFFCEQCLGVTTLGGIHEFQMLWFNGAMKHRRLIVESGTGSSKTEVMGAMYPLWRMFTEKNMKILLVNKTLEQGKSNLLSRIKKYIEDNELLMELFVPEDVRTAWNVTEIKTKQGHWCKNVPYNDHIRGYRADLIICDEIDSYEDTNIFFEHVLSRLYPTGQLIGISTPTGPTKLIGQLKEKSKAGLIDQYHFIKTPYLVDSEGKPAKIENKEDIENYISIWPENWTIDKLREEWGVQGKANWMRNYMCESMGEIDDAIFPMQYIVKSFDYNRSFNYDVDPKCMYFIGGDFAISEGPRADLDAYVVVEKKGDLLIIKHIETHRGLDTSIKINRLEELHNIFFSETGTYIIVDPSSVGTDVMRGLQARGLAVIDSTFQPEARKKLYRTLSNVLASRKLIIPRNPDANDDCVKFSEELREQLCGFKRNKTDRGNEIIDSCAAHDDIAASLAMAINEAIKHQEMDLLPLSG